MRNKYSFLQSGLEIAVILLLVVTSIGSIANQKLHSEEAKNVAMQSEVITKPGYIQFPNKPYTTAMYDENSENDKPFKTKHLQRPRLLETEGHPYKGTNTYQKLEKPVVEVNGDIAESPFDFTQKVELCCDKTKYAGNTFYSHPYEPVTVNQENTPAVLQNFALCFRIHVPDLYNNTTFVFMNKGKTPITISKDSLVAMQSGYKNEKWTGLQCWPVFKGSHQKNSIVEMDIPFNNLLGKTIQPGESISLPFLNWNKYKRKEGFKSATSIVINKVMKEAITLILPVASVKEQKIILWGEDVWSFYKYGNSNKAFHVNILSDDTLEIEK